MKNVFGHFFDAEGHDLDYKIYRFTLMSCKVNINFAL